MHLTESYRPAATSLELSHLTIAGLRLEAATSDPKATALVEGDRDGDDRRRWSYAELLADATATGRRLFELFDADERVAV